MLQGVKRTIFYACRAFGFSLARKPEGGYAFVPNAAFDRERHGDVLRWAEEKIAETKNWAAAEEAKILAKRRDTEEWVALEIAKVEARKREAEEWVGVAEYRIAERGRETKEWIGAEESRIAAQRREAEEWIGSEESRITARRREAEEWVGAEESRITAQRREAEEWVGAEENRITAQRREAEAWVGAEESRITAQRREAEEWVGTEENRVTARRREAEEWIGAEENRITAQRREAEEWVGTEENRIAERRREAEEWVGAEEDRITSLQREAAAWVGDNKSGAEQAEPTRRHDTTPPPDGALSSAPVAPLAEFAAVVDSMRPWSGRVPEGCLVDAVGAVTRASFRPSLANQHWPEREASTQLPTVVADGEGWFEFVDWVVSAREAKDDYVAVSLGAAYGSQLVGAWKALQRLNPLPSLLIAVEAVPENCRWIETHMRDNGIAPEEHVIIQAAVGPDNEVVLFPVGAPGSGLNNAIATNAPRSRATYAQVLSRAEHAGRITRNLLMRNTTGLVRDLGEGAFGEVKFVSAVTLGDILGPLRRVDLLEVDIQQSEGEAIPPFIGLLTRKVRRAHIGTHGSKIHQQLRSLFLRAGWDIVFDYTPNTLHHTEFGPFTTSDGILTVRNPAV